MKLSMRLKHRLTCWTFSCASTTQVAGVFHVLQAGVFLAPGRSDTGVMRAGDAGFAPKGSGHYLRCLPNLALACAAQPVVSVLYMCKLCVIIWSKASLNHTRVAICTAQCLAAALGGMPLNLPSPTLFTTYSGHCLHA